MAQASGHLMASVSSWGFHPLYDDSWWVKLPWVSLEWSLARREEGSGPLKPQHQAGSRVSGGPADTRHPSAKTEARGWCGRGSTLAHPAAGRPVPRPWRSSPSARLWAQRRQWKGQGPGETHGKKPKWGLVCTSHPTCQWLLIGKGCLECHLENYEVTAKINR